MEHLCHLPLSQDAILVAALAGTSMPFACSPEDEAERWLRVLRLHGQVGSVMQALGVGEAPLMTRAESADEASANSAAREEDVVERVVHGACRFAHGRRAVLVGTPDLLFALLEVYGGLIDRALYLRGTSRDEVLECLAVVSLTAGTHD